MKQIRISDDANNILLSIQKVFGGSKRSTLENILKHLSNKMVREIYSQAGKKLNLNEENGEPAVFEEETGNIENIRTEDDEEELEVEWEEEDDEYSEEENYYEDEAEEHTKNQSFSPLEVERSKLELDAIQAGFVTEEERDSYVKRNIKPT